MRRVLLLSSVILLSPLVAGADDVTIAKARAKAALDLMQRQRERDHIMAAKAKAAEALKVRCDSRHCTDDVGAAIEKAKSTGKMIFVWIGFDCKAEPEIRAAFPDAIHCHADSMNGDATPRIIAGRYGDTRRFERKTFNADTPALIKQTLAIPQKTSQIVPTFAVASC